MPPELCRVRLAGSLPTALDAGGQKMVDVRVENVGERTLHSRGPHPVNLAARWFQDGDAAAVADGPRTPLRGELAPGQSQVRSVRLIAPVGTGRYELRVAAVQELVAWFDDVHPGSALAARLEVTPPKRTTPEHPDLPGLADMAAELAVAEPVFRPSAFWEELVAEHLARLDHTGLAGFKRSINVYYFQWMLHGWRDRQVLAVARRWLRSPSAAILRARLADDRDINADGPPRLARGRDRRLYAVFVAMLWEYARQRDRHGVLDTLEEPALGDPLVVCHRGRRISQDVANSALELSAILDALPGGLPPGAAVLEIGAGYGRFAWALARKHPGARVVVVDIPPALALAQRYLTETLPERRVFRFRRFGSAGEVAEELAGADLAFLTPNQLEMIEPLGARLGVNISSLHEMRPEQIERMLGLIDRHVEGFFYSKQWERWENPVDGVVTQRGAYPYPAHWRRLFERRHTVQRSFFEALFATRCRGRGT